MMLRARRRSARPGFEQLESRVTPTDIGVNLNFNSAYNGEYTWVDVHNLFNSWGPAGDPSGGGPSGVAVNSDNYPLAPASAAVRLSYYPDGDYQLSYQGTGTVSFTGIGYLAGPVTTNSSGVSTGTVVVNHDLGNGMTLILTVTGVSATATISNFHLYSPGYGSNPTQMFTNKFLQKLQPFSTIRFENWNEVINSTVSTWQQATPATSFLATTDTGVPYADMIELANESQKDMWINIPALATPNFVQNLAQLIDSNLDPNLNVYVEYSDETWASNWLEYSQVLQAAQSNPLVTATSDWSMVEQQSAYELVSIGQTFRQVFGANSSRIRPIVAGWADSSSYAQVQLQFIQSNYGTPSQYVWGTAIAAYFSLPSQDDVPGLTRDQLFADMNDFLKTTYIGELLANAALAQSYDIPLVSYEGGEGIPSANSFDYQVKQAATTDPRMYQIYVTALNDWNKYVGSTNLFMDFTFDNPYNDSEFFGALQSVTDPGDQKYDGMLSELFPAGDANIDGTVDYADFQILQQNYGLSNAWWEQGDFNDDGVVNLSDLNLLRNNLDANAVTLSQFAQIAIFGQPGALTAGQVSEYGGFASPYALTWQVWSNGQLLSSQTTNSFLFSYSQSGLYTVSLTVTDANRDTASASTNVTVNPPAASATLVKHDTTTQGSWIGPYGNQGWNVIGNGPSYPGFASVTAAGESTLTWAALTSDSRALQNADGIGRVAAAWAGSTSFTILVNLTDGAQPCPVCT